MVEPTNLTVVLRRGIDGVREVDHKLSLLTTTEIRIVMALDMMVELNDNHGIMKHTSFIAQGKRLYQEQDQQGQRPRYYDWTDQYITEYIGDTLISQYTTSKCGQYELIQGVPSYQLGEDNQSITMYTKNGFIHRDDDLPSYQCGSIMSWLKYNTFHRANDLPADICDTYQAWYTNGETHRPSGDPVIVHNNGIVLYEGEVRSGKRIHARRW